MVYVQHVFKAHPEQVFLRYFWLFLWLHFGLEICKVIRLILPKTCKFNTHNSPIFPYKSMHYDLFRSDYLRGSNPFRGHNGSWVLPFHCSPLWESPFPPQFVPYHHCHPSIQRVANETTHSVLEESHGESLKIKIVRQCLYLPSISLQSHEVPET